MVDIQFAGHMVAVNSIVQKTISGKYTVPILSTIDFFNFSYKLLPALRMARKCNLRPKHRFLGAAQRAPMHVVYLMHSSARDRRHFSFNQLVKSRGKQQPNYKVEYMFDCLFWFGTVKWALVKNFGWKIVTHLDFILCYMFAFAEKKLAFCFCLFLSLVNTIVRSSLPLSMPSCISSIFFVLFFPLDNWKRNQLFFQQHAFDRWFGFLCFIYIENVFFLTSTEGNPDTLVCGNCREFFTDLSDLLEHKRSYCKLRFTCKCQENVQSKFIERTNWHCWNWWRHFLWLRVSRINIDQIGVRFVQRLFC